MRGKASRLSKAHDRRVTLREEAEGFLEWTRRDSNPVGRLPHPSGLRARLTQVKDLSVTHDLPRQKQVDSIANDCQCSAKHLQFPVRRESHHHILRTNDVQASPKLTASIAQYRRVFGS